MAVAPSLVVFEVATPSTSFRDPGSEFSFKLTLLVKSPRDTLGLRRDRLKSLLLLLIQPGAMRRFLGGAGPCGAPCGGVTRSGFAKLERFRPSRERFRPIRERLRPIRERFRPIMARHGHYTRETLTFKFKFTNKESQITPGMFSHFAT
eukprot:1196252-Prorocentrum_minimum.AAC.2